MSDLLPRVLEVHGGASRWAEVSELSADVSVSGPYWGLKGWPAGLTHTTVQLDPAVQRISLTPFTEPRLRSAFEVGPERLTVETLDGDIVETRESPRDSFAGYTAESPWDIVQFGYFVGYALWNYLTFPFHLTYPGVRTTEIEPWDEDGETWRRLHVTYPASFATHCPEQVFYFDDRFLQRRMDYAPEVTGGSPAAHYTSGHRTFGGLVVPTQRYVCPRDVSSNGHNADFRFITVDVHSVEVRSA